MIYAVFFFLLMGLMVSLFMIIESAAGWGLVWSAGSFLPSEDRRSFQVYLRQNINRSLTGRGGVNATLVRPLHDEELR